MNCSAIPLIILVGPTAVGKTAASIGLAKALQGEIISGDSMQVFRGLDIGTAKITAEEMEGVPHHLIDIKEPWETFSAAEFKTLADSAIADIYQRVKCLFWSAAPRLLCKWGAIRIPFRRVHYRRTLSAAIIAVSTAAW